VSNPSQPVIFKNLGQVGFRETWESMHAFTLAREKHTGDECWFLEHDPVFTLGQAGKPEHVLNAHDIPLEKTDRGGQVTYHGPGQLVAYLLLDVRRRGMGVRQLVDLIEQSLISLLASYGIEAVIRPGAPGVYVAGEKIAALGLRVKKGCSYHGLSLNVDMDLAPFSYINPCGYPGLGVTQIRDLVAQSPMDLMGETRQRLQEILVSALL
jgi:lipoyl(octanoyl) transferase